MMKQLFLSLGVGFFGFAAGAQPGGKTNTSAADAKNAANDPSLFNAAYKQYIHKDVPEYAVHLMAELSADGGATLEALNIRDFGTAMPDGKKVQPDARVLRSEDTARGTNVAPAIMAALKAAMVGQVVIIGPGDWVVSTPIEIPVFKQVNLVCLGNLHFNKHDGFIVNPPKSGADLQHRLYFYGSLIGRENMPIHTKASRDNGTEPKWSEMTNTGVDITNCNKVFVLINKAEGFGNAVRINGGGGRGGQENTVSYQFLYKNAYGIVLRSTDGNSYVDKNHFFGFHGGGGRISGGCAILIDGFAGAAPNGEPYNGAFRSNEFHVMIEQVDTIMVANGDITEPVFDLTIEAGLNTGVFASGFHMRSTAPNYVRNPKYTGAGIFNTDWLTNGMGVNGLLIGMPVYYKSRLIGFNGKTDATGNVVMEINTPLPKYLYQAMPKTVRTVLVSPEGKK